MLATKVEDHARRRIGEGRAGRAGERAPQKSISTRSQLRRPIFSPNEKAPSGSSETGTVGWPTRPRSGASRRSRPSDLQAVHDRRGRLDGEAGHARDFDLRQRPEAAHQREDQALVVEAHARLIGAAGGSDRRPRRSQRFVARSRPTAGIARGSPCASVILRLDVLTCSA